MLNPFTEKYLTQSNDALLVQQAVAGSRKALEELILRHQAWVYNICLKMLFTPADAEDATQEVLVKVITKLDTFRGQSSFRTWLYRVAFNHVLNVKKSLGERQHATTFSLYWKSIEATPDADLPDTASLPVDANLIVEEVKLSCMQGMLLCLDREQRLAYILGAIFGVNDAVAAEILDVSRANFRQRLSRARRQIHSFMDGKCGLMRTGNPCHCRKKTKALVGCGYVDPGKLVFNANYVATIRQAARARVAGLERLYDAKCRRLFGSHPFQNPPDFAAWLRQLLDSTEFREMFEVAG